MMLLSTFVSFAVEKFRVKLSGVGQTSVHDVLKTSGDEQSGSDTVKYSGDEGS